MNVPAQRGATLGVVALIVCAAMWSLNGPLIKLLQRPESPTVPGVSGLTIACYRSLLGGLMFLPLALRQIRTIRNVRPAWPIGSVITFTLMTACFVIATTKTAAANAIILQYLSPLVVFALSPLLLGEKARWSEGVVLLFAFVGAGIIFLGNPATELGPLTIAACSGLGYGALTVVLRGLKAVDPAVVVALNFLGSGILMALAVPFTPGSSFDVSSRQLAILTVMSVVQFAAPYMLFSWALQRVEAHRASLIVLLETVLNPIWTYFIAHESPPAATLIGGPVILASVVVWMLLSWRRQGNRIEPEESPAAPG